ncbi:MAG: hypothetical protein EBU92_13045, partial [Betaproteobacteria bacterium]|nr:hypothetical protein [Betaproteobacteria bacterium]
MYNAVITNATGFATTVAKTGTGNWELTGSSTYTGGLDIYAGRIVVGGGAEITNSLGAGEVRIYNGGGIRSSGTVTRVDSTNHVYKLGGSNYIDWMDIGKVTLTNNTTVIGNTAIGGETVPVSGNSTTTTLGSNTGIQESGGSFSLTKSGANSVLILNGANSYSGGTFVTSGTLNVTNTGTLGSASSAVTVSGGTLDLGAAARTNATVTVSGGTLQNGSFSATTVNITGGTIANTVTNTAATINISGGTLGTSALSASSAFNYGGGATGISTVALGGAGRFYLTNSTLTLS